MVGKRGLGQSGNFPQDIHLAAHGKTNLKGRIMKSLLANHSEVQHLPFPNKMTTARQLYLVTPETLNTVTANLSVCTIYRKFQKLFILATFGFSSMEHQPYCSKKKKQQKKNNANASGAFSAGEIVGKISFLKMYLLFTSANI